MLDAAKMAEEVLTSGQAPLAAGQDGEEEDEVLDGRPGSPTPSTSTVATTAVDVSHLTPQTYLVRPTRPDANRNRGRNAFKRKPATNTAASGAASVSAQGAEAASSSTVVQPSPRTTKAPTEVDDEVENLPEVDEFDDSIIEEMEHLQLSLEEAWFSSSALGVLKIYDPATVSRICMRANQADDSGYISTSCSHFTAFHHSHCTYLLKVTITSRRPFFGIVCGLPSFPIVRLGCQTWYQIRSGLAVVQAWTCFLPFCASRRPHVAIVKLISQICRSIDTCFRRPRGAKAVTVQRRGLVRGEDELEVDEYNHACQFLGSEGRHTINHMSLC